MIVFNSFKVDHLSGSRSYIFIVRPSGSSLFRSFNTFSSAFLWVSSMVHKDYILLQQGLIPPGSKYFLIQSGSLFSSWELVSNHASPTTHNHPKRSEPV